MEQIIVLMVDLSQSHVSPPLLTIDLETMAPSWAISYVLALPTSVLTWEKWVVSN
jgi:hypothetical protein